MTVDLSTVAVGTFNARLVSMGSTHSDPRRLLLPVYVGGLPSNIASSWNHPATWGTYSTEAVPEESVVPSILLVGSV